jgi:hypothetical protein
MCLVQISGESCALLVSNYIALVFFADFVIGPIQGGVTHPIEYVPFSILIIVGPLLRVAAVVRRPGLGAKVPIFRVSPN